MSRPTRPNQIVGLNVSIDRRVLGGRRVDLPLLVLTDHFDGKRVVVELDQGRIDRLIAALEKVRPTAPPRPLGEMLG